MRSRALFNAGLFLLAVVLALVVYVEPGKQPELPPIPVTLIDPASVTRVRIEHRGGEMVELRKEAAGWFLESPFALAANDHRVETLARAGAAASRAEIDTDVEPDSLARFGLGQPHAVLFLDDQPIAFGDTEPLSGNRYIRVGESVHLIDDLYFHELSADPASFAHPALLPRGAEPAEFGYPAFELVLTDGRWTLTPDQDDASADGVSALVDAWRNAQALSVNSLLSVSEGAASEPEQTIRVRLEGEADAIRFEIRRSDYELLFARPDIGIQYHLSTAAGERLLALKAPPAAEAD